MAQRPTVTVRSGELRVFADEPILYHGWPIRRGLALLIETERTNDLDELLRIGNCPITDEPVIPDSHVRNFLKEAGCGEPQGSIPFDGPEYRVS